MKVRLLCALLALSFVGCMGADDAPESPTEGPLNQLSVRQLSEKNINLHRDRIISQQDTRTLFNNLAIGAAVVGAGYMYLSWLNGPNLSQPTPLKAHIQLAKRVKDLQEENERLADDIVQIAGQRPQQSWGRWIKGCCDWAGNLAYTLTPSIIWGLGRSYVAGELSRFVFPALPTIGSYLSQNSSLNWCMIKRTHFYHSVIMMMNWTAGVVAQPDASHHSKELITCSNQFVHEMEKVLGYMGYVVEELTEKHAVYKERGKVTIETIATEVQGLVGFINGYLSIESPTEDDMIGMIVFLKKALFSIICQMENFESVTIQAKLADPEEPDMFSQLKSYVMPEWQQLRPEVPGPDQESEFIRKILTQIAEQNL